MTARKSARKRSTAKRVRAGVAKGLKKVERLSDELPASLDEFSRRMHKQLSLLERDVERAEARARREIARVLRKASHRLGGFEADGEREWKRLTTQARREALTLLRKLEKRLEPRRPRAKRTASAKRAKAAATAPKPLSVAGG